jgi:hypothetical protein
MTGPDERNLDRITVRADPDSKIVHVRRGRGKTARAEWIGPLTRVTYDADDRVLAVEFHNALLSRPRPGTFRELLGRVRGV